MAPAQGGKMFNNLIESRSHTREFKRRGSFFLFTIATYILLFVIAGVASIYAYDARLEDQNAEFITMLNPMEPTPPTTTPRQNNTTQRGTAGRQNIAVREIRMAPVDNLRVTPDSVSAVPNKNLPIPPSGFYKIGDHDSNPIGPGGERPGSGESGRDVGGGGSPVIEIGTPPPPVVIERAVPKVISKGVINGEALSLPKPGYPTIAKQLRIQGVVSVQILIDETGKVISAKVLSGNPSLATAARQAAFEARFSPTRLSNQPVKVSGVITYNFVLQ
jgi:TonB family protein